jgi:methionine-rich copper-binding protein CopC
MPRLLLGALAGALLVPSLWFHTHLTRSNPTADSTVPAPAQVELWFSERPERAVSRIVLFGPDSSRTVLPLVAASSDTLLIAGRVPATLTPGAYTIEWRTASDDGHPARGRFGFTVAPNTPAKGH